MPTATVDDSGHYLYYEDTGPVEGRDDYVTIVCVHGLIFHGSAYSSSFYICCIGYSCSVSARWC